MRGGGPAEKLLSSPLAASPLALAAGTKSPPPTGVTAFGVVKGSYTADARKSAASTSALDGRRETSALTSSGEDFTTCVWCVFTATWCGGMREKVCVRVCLYIRRQKEEKEESTEMKKKKNRKRE